VIGTVIGAGVFTMPAVLAGAGTVSLAVLGVIAVGAMVLAVLFGQLSRRVPNSDGGLYAYARHEFGDFAGYLTGWCYWVQAWAGNAAIVSSKAKEEHDVFAEILRDQGVQVHYFEQLLAETLERPEGRAFVLDRTCTPSYLGPTLVGPVRELFDDLDGPRLAEYLIGGVLKADLRPLRAKSLKWDMLAADDFLLAPLPNHLFTRDNSAWIYGGVSMNPMAMPARQREHLHMRAVYDYHPMFAGAGFLAYYGDDDADHLPASVEGGDVHVLGHGAVLIGMGEGGNALLERGEKPDEDIQEHHVQQAASSLAPLARAHDLIVTHGNGPQVGLLALESASDPALTRPYSLDALGAQTQGMIGYWLARALRGPAPGRPALCLVSQTRVDPDDPAFAHPTKFVGPVYEEKQARDLAAERGWVVRPDGSAWRRVVPSPEPLELIELPLIRLLLGSGALVVCAGGGGIPVVADASGALRGVEAVVDKDLTAALLARAVDADALLLLTDVEAACRFVEATGKMAAIGRLDAAADLLRGAAGTIVSP
jgi:carbamate kinase